MHDGRFGGLGRLCASAGEEETDLDVGEMVRKGEVAWLSAEEMKAAAEPPPNAYPLPENGERKVSPFAI